MFLIISQQTWVDMLMITIFDEFLYNYPQGSMASSSPGRLLRWRACERSTAASAGSWDMLSRVHHPVFFVQGKRCWSWWPWWLTMLVDSSWWLIKSEVCRIHVVRMEKKGANCVISLICTGLHRNTYFWLHNMPYAWYASSRVERNDKTLLDYDRIFFLQ